MSSKKCPNCGSKMNSYDTFWDCEVCGEFKVKKGYETKEEKEPNMPYCCSACGNPAYPNCKTSCSIFDD